MATADEVSRLRRITDYTGSEPYDDLQLSALIDEFGMYRLASRMWEERAATLHSYVNISESGSSRQTGDLYDRAMKMAKYYKGLADEEEAETPVDVSRFARTRAIVREG